MKNNSDESDYEVESFDNHVSDESVEETEAYPSFFSEDGHKKRKRHATLSDAASQSESNDSDDNKDYYEEGNNMKVRSHNMYQDLSYGQDLSMEGSSHSIQKKSIDEAPLNYESDEGMKLKSSYQQDYHVSKKQKFHKTINKSDDDANEQHHGYNLKEQLSKPEPKSSFSMQGKGYRMMKEMGYKDGCGLGKQKQGRLEPVQASKQNGRMGFGHHLPGLEDSSRKWNLEDEEIKVIEDMEWISNLHGNIPTYEKMLQWLQTGPKKLSLDDEFQFCHEDVIGNILKAKSAFDTLGSTQLERARRRCNPYETIRGAFFLNRAAVKMANIDKACDFMFTEPDCVGDNELLYFADVCAGPGGFSEYVLWRKKWRAKGFGLTLKDENDFKLGDFYAAPCETFHPYYGPKGNGDVYDPANQTAFRDLIMKHTQGKGVHFMMSDGGFCINEEKNIQEILSKQLYLCQCLVALMIVRVKGHFVTKLFDLFTPFSAGLVYLMYRCFEEVCLFKPNSSRPANSERYLICKTKRDGIEPIMEYLNHVNHILLESKEDKDVTQLVSFKELEKERQFLEYLRNSNNELGRKQIIALRKIAAYCMDSTLVETKQGIMRIECLKYWGLPDENRRLKCLTPQHRVASLLKNSQINFKGAPKVLDENNINKEIMGSVYSWFCMPCATERPDTLNTTNNATFYYGAGRGKVYRYATNSWKLVDIRNLELPPDTLVYAEIVREMRGRFRLITNVPALHIIDAFALGGEDISKKYLTDRHMLTKLFCEALWKPEESNSVRVRVKELIPVRSDVCQRLELSTRTMKNNLLVQVYQINETDLERSNSDTDKPYFIPNSVIFLNSTAYPWGRFYSQTHSLTYLFHTKTKQKLFDCEKRPSDMQASFSESFEKRVIWYWPEKKSLDMETFARHIAMKCSPKDTQLKY